LLQDVPGGASHDGGDERLVVGVGRQHHAGRLRHRRPDLAADLDAAPIRQPHVENGDVRLCRRNARQGVGDGARLADHVNVLSTLEQGAQARPDHLMIVEEEDTQCHGLIFSFAPKACSFPREAPPLLDMLTVASPNPKDGPNPQDGRC
jgi:hypothetical protein